ncbi:MAG TPA: glycoside hydrolase family 25 protein [Reyranella sp.]|nr:glycoside hydrolase family 25 protein [Reyranella sp.]
MNVLSRRSVLTGLAATATAGCAARPVRQTARATARVPVPAPYPVAPPPPDRASLGLDAVIDISQHASVTDFRRVRQSNILAVIHKASEGDFFADPACAARRPQAEEAGLLWGTYHFGKGDSAGAQQAAFYLAASQPGPATLLALDLELNEGDPSNSMSLEQAEAFVGAVADATGRLPIVYVHPTWANGDPLPGSGASLGARITPGSILARCGLWVADYHDSPEVPLAWAATGWRLWQYAGDGGGVPGVDRCDRNLFNGDASALYRFWRTTSSLS